MADWPTLIFTGPPAALDTVAELLLAAAYDSDAGEGLVGTRLDDSAAPGGLRLVATFRTAAGRDAMESSLPALLQDEDVRWQSSQEEDLDWVALVAATEVAVPLGSGFAALPGAAEPLAGRDGIRLPRSRAFGTGEHATTRMAAALLEQYGEAGAPLLDLGTGTGILAILGLRLGQRPVVALDVDPVACGIARQALVANGATEIRLAAGTLDSLPVERRFRTITANIERDTLIAAMPGLISHLEPGGMLILTGLLREQVDAVADSAARCGGIELERRHMEEWGALLVTRRPALLPRVLVAGGFPDPQGRIPLPADEAHHLTRARRLAPGAAIEVCDGQGRSWRGVLARGDECWFLDESTAFSPGVESPCHLTLYPSILHESGRMETLLQQAVELGVARVQPIRSRRCQGARKRQVPMQRWRRIVAEAVKQCGRVNLPAVLEPVSLPEAAAAVTGGLFLDPSGLPLSRILRAPARPAAGLLLGPEGGLDAEERTLLLESGWQGVRLGPRILRAGTASTAALSLVLSAWGDMGENPIS